MPVSRAASQKKRRAFSPFLKKPLRAVFFAFAAVLLIGLFYLAVILGQPEEPESVLEVLQDQPLLTPSPAVSIHGSEQLALLEESFPVPVLAFMEGLGPTLESGVSYDQPFEDGYARTLELTYRTDSGTEIRLTSIYPARAISLIEKGDYVLTGASDQTLTGLSAVRMEDAENVRIHAQSTDAIYVITVPQLSADSLSAFTRALELVDTAN